MYTSYLAKKQLNVIHFFRARRRGSTLFLRSVAKTSTALVIIAPDSDSSGNRIARCHQYVINEITEQKLYKTNENHFNN